MTDFTADLRSAVRICAQARWTTLAIVATLALGTGLNCAVLAVTYGVLLRPLPYQDASRIVRLDHRVPFKELDDWQQRLQTIETLAIFAGAEHTLRGLGEPQIVRAAFVSDRFFDVLQARPLAGRTLGPDTSEAGAVISERLVRALRLDQASVVGTPVTIVGRSLTVLGVMPSTVGIPDGNTDIWLPARTAAAVPLVRDDDRSYGLLARLKSGVSAEQAAEDATRVRQNLSRDSPEARAKLRVAALPLEQALRRSTRPIILAFVAGALLVLAIACANVANLLLGRTTARERELAVRLALGCTRARLLQSLFVEGLLLALAGSIAGVLVALGGLHVLRMTAGAVVPRVDAIRLDTPVLFMTLGIATVVALLCTLGPGIHVLRRGVSPIVRQTGAAGLHSGRRMASSLAVAQIALSIVVLIGAVLLGRSIFRLLRVDVGVDTSHAVTMKLMLADATLLKPGERQAFVQQLLERVQALPGVQHVALGSNLPPSTSQVDIGIRLVGDGRDEMKIMNYVSATPDFARALGMRLLAGRFLEPADATGGQLVAVITPSVARHLFGERDPVGREVVARIPADGGRRARVVGVVDEVRYSGLTERPEGAIYIPWQRLPLGVVYLVVRTAGDPLAAVPAIRGAIADIDVGQPVAAVRSLEDTIAGSLAGRRFHAFVASGFAVLACGVALLGLVATLGRMVAQRRHELAVRSALGATPRQAVGLIMTDAVRLTIGGVLAGTALALMASRTLQTYLFEVSSSDPAAYMLVAAATIAAALLACLIPAYRAASVDPATLLRAD
jgi:putative ABC transport system permease protein